MTLTKSIIQATRPRTYPLAVASILCGTGLAISKLIDIGQGISAHHWLVFALTLWVALALQILSNLANDYGDGIKGTDTHRHQDSPTRMLATGQLSPQQFKTLIYLWALLTFCSGVALISIGFNNLRDFLLFLGFGIIAILAAMAYTMGKRPYGYRAMGEVAVLIFFGWLGVLGSVYLQTHTLHTHQFLIATGCGSLAACVLFVNNMRDFYTDKQAGKLTLAILVGEQNMFSVYTTILSCAYLLYLMYAINFNAYGLLVLLTYPHVAKHANTIHQSKIAMGDKTVIDTQRIGKELKTIVLITLAINVLFFCGCIASYLSHQQF